MERKLELADIVMYLPYGLKVAVYYEDKLSRFANVDGFYKNDFMVDVDIYSPPSYVPIEHSKPILRPMSDLTKPTTHPDINNGEEFVPSNIIKSILLSRMIIENENFWFSIDEECWEGNTQGMRWDSGSEAYQLLDKLHFDYNGLINQGLAIDINTLNK